MTAVCLIDIEEQILQHLQLEFKTALHYVAIASVHEPSTSMSTIYIQIILHKAVSKHATFLHAVAGVYRRTPLCRNTTYGMRIGF